MDNQVLWKEEYNIGVDIIDHEHQKLFQMINRLFALRAENKKNPRAYQEGIAFIKEHAMSHFENEELYMKSIGYKGLKMHQRLHRGFREDTLPALEEELLREDYSPSAVDHFLGVCTGWLIGHTLTEDQAITGEKMSKWLGLLPDEEVKAMEMVIVCLIQDMFQLEAKLVSDAYGGERFGKGIYYRLIYDAGDVDKQWEIVLVFEEKLLVNTVGKIMGISSDKLDVMLINASRYVAKQFVWWVMQHFPSFKLYEMKQENLLTYDKFKEVFTKKKPQVSFLFATGAGYFSYCVIAPHLLEEGIGVSIGADNAMAEIERYLIKRERTIKPKILVVDDSVMIRQGMKNLLSKDYDVNVARSGMAAIRAITLDKPDLVMLDYEMPVCDGMHTLEMLRSEEEYADVPVIFLTGRGDPESVKKVLDLKPEGYMLKYLKPTEIKNRIDEYFNRKRLQDRAAGNLN